MRTQKYQRMPKCVDFFVGVRGEPASFLNWTPQSANHEMVKMSNHKFLAYSVMDIMGNLNFVAMRRWNEHIFGCRTCDITSQLCIWEIIRTGSWAKEDWNYLITVSSEVSLFSISRIQGELRFNYRVCWKSQWARWRSGIEVHFRFVQSSHAMDYLWSRSMVSANQHIPAWIT
jgi:hypothetical protein